MFTKLSTSVLILLAIIIVDDVKGLSTSKSPGDQFDLSVWKITLPDSSASEKSPSQLESDYESSYFYTDSDDGSMTFYVKGSGGTTSGTDYPRSELRQLCNPSGGDRYNWGVSSGTNYVEGKYRIGKLNSASTKVVIQQIHAYDGPPLVKMQYESGKIYAMYKTNEAGSSENKVEVGSVSTDEQFTLKTQTSSGYLKIYFNGSQKLSVKVSSYWGDYKNYFKAGNYLQSSSSSAYAYIHMYTLKVSTSSSNCEYTSSSFTQEDELHDHGRGPMPIEHIVGMVIGVLIVVLCAVLVYVYWRKTKFDRDSRIKLEESVKESGGDNKEGGDTPMMDSDGATTANSTGEYDMNVIAITVPSVPTDDGDNNNNDV